MPEGSSPAAPFPVGLTPLRANLQAFAVLAVAYGAIYGGALLRGTTRPSSPGLSALALGSAMLLLTALFVRKDADWKQSLGVARPAPLPTVGYGLLGVAMGYAVNILLVLPYLAIRGNLKQQAADKAKWTSALNDLPILSLLPLAMFVGFWEEVVFRGFILGRLRVALGAGEGAPPSRTVLAIVFTGLLFGGAHGYQGPTGLLQTSALGIAFGVLTVWRKSVWPAVIAHLTIDAVSLFALRVAKPLLEEFVKKSGVQS